MNTKIFAAFILASAIAAPAFADGDPHYPDQQLSAVSQPSTVTRAQVRQELAQLRKAGYTQSGDDSTYPAEIQAAEARVQAAQTQTPAASSDGGVQDQTSESGSAHKVEHKLHLPVGKLENDGMKPIFFGG